MEQVVGLVVLVCIAAVMVCLALVARRARRRGAAGPAIAAAMAAYDEAMHSTAFDAVVEIRTRDERGAHRPSPRDDLT